MTACVKILHFDLSQKAEKRCCVLPMLEHVYAARPNFDETRNGERASEKKKEKEPQPSVYVCIFVLVTGTRRDNPLLSAMPRVGSRQRC